MKRFEKCPDCGGDIPIITQHSFKRSVQSAEIKKCLGCKKQWYFKGLYDAQKKKAEASKV
jgi:uncharacterized protein with PIN domain